MSGSPTASNVRATGTELDGGAAHQPASVAPEVRDASRAVHLHPCPQHVCEAEAVGGAQRLQILDHLGRRLVVVGHARIERESL